MPYQKIRNLLRYRYSIFLVAPICAGFSIWFSYQLRFDFDIPFSNNIYLPQIVTLVMAIKVAGIFFFRFHSLSWRHTGLSVLIRVGIYAIACAVIIFMARVMWPQLAISRGALLIDLFLTVLWVGMLAIGPRLVREVILPVVSNGGNDKLRTVLIGAGDAGDLVLRELARNPHATFDVKAIFDDNPHKKGYLIQGINVIGTVDDLKDYVQDNEIDVVLVAIPSANRSQMRRIYEKVKDLKVSVKTLPSLLEMVDESRPLIQFRDINIQDLLGREEIKIRYRDIDQIITDKVVLVTGAGGSIGSEICRQTLSRHPKLLILLERNENLLFHINRKLSQKIEDRKDIKIVPLLIDCKDYDSVHDVFVDYSPSVVLHAAAHKHVPLQEMNPIECFRNNVGGIQTLVRISHETNVERFVLISTDKAVNPVSVMGATKRTCELYCLAYATISRTMFMAVRFGNVLGSEGSVVPIFLEQIARGGPVTVTHPEVTRYFMSIPEAVALVLQAAAIGKSGELMMLDMGSPVKILDLARQLIFLAGRTEHEIGVKISGLRSGEKLFEELSCDWETCLPTNHEKIRIFSQQVYDGAELLKRVDAWVEASFHSKNGFKAKVALKDIVPEYKPQTPVSDTDLISTVNPK